MPYITYSNMVDHFIEDVYDFVSKHPEYELNRYHDILETNNIKWEKESMQNTDVSSLDEKCVVALLVGTVRAERFCDGVPVSYTHLLPFGKHSTLDNGSYRRHLLFVQCRRSWANFKINSTRLLTAGDSPSLMCFLISTFPVSALSLIHI